MNIHIQCKCDRKRGGKGFTLIEVLVVIGIIAILASIVLVAVNPARQFKIARDSQRTSNVNAILNAIHQNISEHKGSLVCGGLIHDLVEASVTMAASTSSGDPGHLAPCLVPDYISALPFDPTVGGAYYSDVDDYNTGYNVSRDPSGRITVSAVGELTPVISVTR